MHYCYKHIGKPWWSTCSLINATLKVMTSSLYLPVNGADGIEGPLHVLVELPETIFSPELNQVDPAAPPCVRDLLKAPHLSIHTPLSYSSTRPTSALCSDTHSHWDVHAPHGPDKMCSPVSSRVVTPLVVVSSGPIFFPSFILNLKSLSVLYIALMNW